MDFLNSKPLKLWEFKQWPSSERVHLVSEDGIFIALRENKKFQIFLFWYGTFYVEIYSNRQTQQAIRATPMLSKKKLDAYLDLISIEDINRY